MFIIISYGQIIGHSELEQGDPPMGVAFGRFIPAANFDRFVQTVQPNMMDDDEVQIWNKLTAMSPRSVMLECAGVALFRYVSVKFEIEYEINVLGIVLPQYDDLFPHHVRAYELRFPCRDP